jgi:hypothetical protein
MALQAIFRSTVVAKLLYAASAWSGFIKMPDRQRVDALLRRSKKCGYCPPDLSKFDELCDRWTKNCLMIYSQTRTICYPVYFRHLQMLRRIIISTHDHIAKNYLNHWTPH